MTAAAHVPPQNLEAEESVLGAMLISRDAIITCSEILTPTEFYRQSHGLIFRAIVDLDMRDEPVDAVTLPDFLDERDQLEQAGGRVRIHELAQLVPAASNAAHYARIVKEMFQLRGLITTGHELARMGYERPGEIQDLIEKAETLVLELAHRRDNGELQQVAGSLTDTYRLMGEMSHQDVTGTPTGIAALDDITAGLQPGNMIVLAARPSMGKSALALGIARHVTLTGQPAAVFSLEMSRTEVAQRLISLHTGIGLQKLRKPKTLQPDEWARVQQAVTELSLLPLHLDDTAGARITDIRSRARRLKQRLPDLGLIIVDYLQLMIGEARIENRVQEVSQISRGLKVLARDLHVPVIAVSQLNRGLELRHDKRPMLSDLRESGAIEQDADLVIFIYRDEVYNKDTDKPGTAELIVAKHRNGPTDMVEARWQKQTARFTDA